MSSEPVFAFEELAHFLAGLSPRKVMTFQTSKKSKDRVNYLLSKNSDQGLSIQESREMEQYMLIEHIVQLAKAKALLRIVKK